jgi:hypothetical protein
MRVQNSEEANTFKLTRLPHWFVASNFISVLMSMKMVYDMLANVTRTRSDHVICKETTPLTQKYSMMTKERQTKVDLCICLTLNGK